MEFDAILDVFQVIVFTGTTGACVQWLNDNPEKRVGYDAIMGSTMCIVTVYEYLDNFGEEAGEFVTPPHGGTLAWWWFDVRV
jgi:hypothetical protein